MEQLNAKFNTKQETLLQSLTVLISARPQLTGVNRGEIPLTDGSSSNCRTASIAATKTRVVSNKKQSKH
jgi:hypothetical protein